MVLVQPRPPIDPWYHIWGMIIYITCVVVILYITHDTMTQHRKAMEIHSTKLVRVPLAELPKCCFCGELLDCPKCGAANFSPMLNREHGP